MRALAVKVLNQYVGCIWLERDTIIPIHDVAVGNLNVVAAVHIPAVYRG